MGEAEQRILGAVVIAAAKDGVDCTVLAASGEDALLKMQAGAKTATMHLKLDGGTEMITDAVGDPDLYVGALEVAQNVCEEIWRDE